MTRADEQVVVEYAADIDATVCTNIIAPGDRLDLIELLTLWLKPFADGSGFTNYKQSPQLAEPRLGDVNDDYNQNPWNLNVLPGLPNSMLRRLSGISGVSTPWVCCVLTPSLVSEWYLMTRSL